VQLKHAFLNYSRAIKTLFSKGQIFREEQTTNDSFGNHFLATSNCYNIYNISHSS